MELLLYSKLAIRKWKCYRRRTVKKNPCKDRSADFLGDSNRMIICRRIRRVCRLSRGSRGKVDYSQLRAKARCREISIMKISGDSRWFRKLSRNSRASLLLMAIIAIRRLLTIVITAKAQPQDCSIMATISTIFAMRLQGRCKGRYSMMMMFIFTTMNWVQHSKTR